MLTLNVTYRCKPGQREAFYEALCELGTRRIANNERGNICYDYYFGAELSDDLFLLECWEDDSALDEHKQTASFAKLQELKAQYCADVIVARFDD